MQQEQLLTLPQVEQMIGFKKSFIWKAIKEGTFPNKIKITAKAVRWKLSEVQEWIQKQIDMNN